MSDQIQVISSNVVPVLGDDIDTDRIVPARFLKEITFKNMGQYLFHDARFNEDESPKDHPLNDPQYNGAEIMVVGKNFGCGSSREHAPQAIKRYGIKAIIGESFAEIFAGNCKNIGIATVTASKLDIENLLKRINLNPQTLVTINLMSHTIRYNDQEISLDIHPAIREALVTGAWDAAKSLRENVSKVRELANKIPY